MGGRPMGAQAGVQQQLARRVQGTGARPSPGPPGGMPTAGMSPLAALALMALNQKQPPQRLRFDFEYPGI
jgi:hypothetical protein